MIAAMAGKTPGIEPSAFVASTAAVIGDVVIGARSSIWFGAVARGDENAIRIGVRTNVQDACVLHVDGQHALQVGDDVTVGHRAMLHGCTIRDRVLIGMGATVMNGATIGEDSIVGAGALVTEGMAVPPRSLVLGVPARVKRELTEEERERLRASAEHYVRMAETYRKAVR